ncbi:hypothetical protein [Frigidibacter sp. ROC022]|uniref:hypothetical protein n=1 Tax=Frigidibacter sp. ROC022 TaxID=2971796 RepID=UPI00215A2BF1|nr:hypothetical protein [Frigidibacter sp. ROC022]MCR8723466.1 hypothetical protein [Frigidibacter sp. ROC022]
MLKLLAGPNGLTFDASLGNIPDLWFGPLTPLHRAQWHGTCDGDATLSKVEQRLAGDFLCMPFGKSDLTGDPQHGYTSNSAWDLVTQAPGKAVLRLARTVQGATVEKHLELSAEAPLLCQTHVVTGGEGAITLAHHPMVQARGARLSMSPKTAFIAPSKPLEKDENIFLPGARSTALTAIRGVAGPVDLSRYPETRCEDFLTAVEAPGNPLGWTAVTRDEDVVFVLKDPQVLPVTMLWLSNGGREAAPWHRRHRGVLGIEDGIAPGAEGHRAASADNPVRREGVATCLILGPRHVIRHVIGAIPRPADWQSVADIAVSGARLSLTGDSGSRVDLPIDPAIFGA